MTETPVLSREQRDVLRMELTFELDGVLNDLRGPAADGTNLDEMTDMRRRVAIGLWLLDDLGWELHGTRETYYLTVPEDRLRSWLIGRRVQTHACLEDTAVALGDPWRTWGALIKTPSKLLEEVESARETCDRDLDVLAVFDTLLDQIQATR